MECPNEDGGTLCRYVGGRRGVAVFCQEDGKWLKMQGWPKVSVSNGTVTAAFVFGAVAEKDFPASSIKKSAQFREHYKWV
jgi:hypothetical protein